MSAPLTDRQAEVLAAIRRFWATECRSPTVRELGAALGIGSPNGVVAHLKPLAAKNAIEWDQNGSARCIWPAGLKDGIRKVLELL